MDTAQPSVSAANKSAAEPDQTPFTDDQRKHLEMIQAVISRLAGTSFAIRGWSVGLVTALLAFTAKDHQRAYVLIAYFPSVVFWCLDTWYLRSERLFRSLFAAAARRGTKPPVPLHSMDPTPTATDRDTWTAVFFSPTILGFHGPLLVVVTFAMWLVPKVAGSP